MTTTSHITVMGWHFDGNFRCHKHEPVMQRKLGAEVEELKWSDRMFWHDLCEICEKPLYDFQGEDGCRGYKEADL